MRRDLADFPGFLGVEVLPGGVQISLAHPFRDRTERVIRAAGGAAPSATGEVPDGRVPVVRSCSCFNRAELVALRARGERARLELLRGGVEITGITPDLLTGTVVVEVEDSSDATERALSRRYGPALVVRSSR